MGFDVFFDLFVQSIIPVLHEEKINPEKKIKYEYLMKRDA